MRNDDQRYEKRVVPVRQPRGELLVHIRGAIHSVISVRDVSSTGVGVLINREIPVPCDVAVEFKNREIDLKVNGSAVWCSPTEIPAADGGTQTAYVLGVKLIGPHLLLAVMQAH